MEEYEEEYFHGVGGEKMRERQRRFGERKERNYLYQEGLGGSLEESRILTPSVDVMSQNLSKK